MILKLPIFPLHTVLFPGAPLQLHIFEERYRIMVGRCLEQQAPFGVTLIRTGGEISPDDPWVRRQIEAAGGGDAELQALRQRLGGESMPYAIGTTAQISAAESVRLDDGRYYIVAVGQRRFRIQYLVQRQPYLVASVAYLPETSTPNGAAAAEELRALYKRYWDAASATTGAERPSDTPPENITEFSYWMAHRLKVEHVQKQRWLETDVSSRLRAMTAALRTELAMFRDTSDGQHKHGQGGSLN